MPRAILPRAILPRAILALDFGGSKLAVGVRRPAEREWLAQGRCWAPSDQGARAVLQRMLALADEQLSLVDATPCAIGISFDGPVDFSLGRPHACHHVQGWEGFPLQSHLEHTYRAPAALENDATAAALGEWCYGAGRGVRNMLYIMVSTGVGGGLILEGALYRGMGMAGEIGHMCLDPLWPTLPLWAEGMPGGDGRRARYRSSGTLASRGF